MRILSKASRLLIAGAILLVGIGRPCPAYKQFQDQWQELYLAEHQDDKYVEMVRKKAKCHVCHQGRKKSDCNPYGKHFLGKLAKGDRKDEEKIVSVIREIGKLRTNPDDDASPTYDELVAQSKLPGGSLESVKKKPAKKSE